MTETPTRRFQALDAIPSILAIALVCSLFALHVSLALQHPYFNNFSNVEDWAYTNIAARNYLNFGFLRTLFLQDYAASMFPADHPFIYNHMPPGPDLLTALFLFLTGGDHHWTRIIFGALVLPGLYFYVRFVKLVFAPYGIPGAALALLAAGPYIVLNHLQAEVHSAFLLLTFAPMCLVIESNVRGGRWRFPAAVVLTFLLSIYIQYILLAAAMFAWIFLHVCRVAPISRKQTMIIVGTIIAGIAAHLLQNLIYLGPNLFFTELIYTLGNRTVGVPTQEELRDFYISSGIVHHGAQRANLEYFVFTLVGNLKFRFAVLLVPMLAVWILAAVLYRFYSSRIPGVRSYFSASSGIGEEERGRLVFFLRLFAWAALTIIAVILLFPAHTQEVNLSSYGGINLLLFAVPCAAMIGQGLSLARPIFAPGGRSRLLDWMAARRELVVIIATWACVVFLAVIVAALAKIWPRSLADHSWAAVVQSAANVIIWTGQRATSPESRGPWIIGLVIFGAIVAAGCWRFWPQLQSMPDGGVEKSSASGQAGTSRIGSEQVGKTGGAHLILLGATVRAFLVFAALLTTVAIVTRDAKELARILDKAAEPTDLAPLISLKEYKGQLFMTNINVPTIGYFAESPGYGVCARDAVGTDGTLNVKECKIQQMRRTEYWLSQRPAHFVYFKQARVFPGFATCWPKGAYLGVLRGGSGCNEELGERLDANFRMIASNDLFDVYDLGPTPARAGDRR